MSTEALLGERQKTHGEYREHARCTQAIMRAVMTERNWERLSDIQRESLHMFAHKMGRIAVGNPDEPDHWKDIAGYAVLVEQRLAKPKLTVEQAVEFDLLANPEAMMKRVGKNKSERRVPRYEMPKYQNEANGMIPGDRVQYTIDGRVGIALEFLQDGDATMQFEDGSVQMVKWNHLRKVEHVNLVPWCVDPGFFVREGIPSHLANIFWNQRTQHLMVLEPHVISGKLPRVLQRCYTLVMLSGEWLLDIKECPPDARDMFPNLYREKNQMEWEQLPEWQRNLYARNDEANKYELTRPEWHVESE